MKPLFVLNIYLWRYRWHLVLGAVFVTISNVFGVLPAQIVRHSFDLVKENLFLYRLTDGFDLQSNIYTHFGEILLIFAMVVLIMAILRGFFMFMMRQTIIVMSRHVEFDMKNDIYDHFQKLSTAYYRKNNTGDLMARITEDVSKVRFYIGPAIMYTINLSTLIVLVVGIMLTVNVTLTFYVLLPLPVLALSIYYVNSIIQRKSLIIQEQLSRLTTFTQEMFSGIRVIKSFASESSVDGHFKDECESYRQKSMGLVKVNSLFFPLIILLIGFSTLLTLFVGGMEVMAGNITAGNIAEFFIYVNLLTWPVASIGWVTSIIQRAAASQARINAVWDQDPEIVSDKNKQISLKGNIEFDHVDFVYPDTGIKALQDINLAINSGENIGIIGKTGSGKSTFANLLFRLYDVTSGQLKYDGIDVKDLDPGYFRRQIGYVPQDDFLFSDSIANNLLFGYHKEYDMNKNEDKERVYSLLREVTEITDVKKDILQFPQGFETKLGERGVTLSGGQKQRISIARALVGNPKILILDDCFSAVDTHTEARILQQLGNYMTEKTSILISHRVSTVKNADKIIVLDQGCIHESGNHDELIKKEGYYYELYQKQMLEKELYQDLLE
ncbi:MAG: ABC transporter [Bacteroidetes bacterium SW_10_40_5]|nr:MAG: ABC transporter [Bacteroidetes bacterium SW_10_40_5]